MSLSKEIPEDTVDETKPEVIKGFALSHLLEAQDHLIEARMWMDMMSKDEPWMEMFLVKLTYFLGPLGEAAYSMRPMSNREREKEKGNAKI